MCCRNFFFLMTMTSLLHYDLLKLLLYASYLTIYFFISLSLTLIIISYQIGFNIDHDTTSGSLGGAQPRVRWQTDDISIGGLFDLQVRIVDIGCVFSDVDNNNEE
ncbi:MAG: hypothetical protein ACI8RD_014147 [Bacillariaceae sp.]|jgi:hypothetical protein